MHRVIKTCTGLLLAVIAGLNCTALAWSDLGHMAVAYITYSRLTEKSRARIRSLLALNPYYEIWKSRVTAACPPENIDAEIFMLAATWPDSIKKDPAYKSDGIEGGNRPQGPESEQNSGYADHNMHKYWHFYDLPFCVGREKLPVPPTPNALSQIDRFRKVLSSNAPDELKSYDLIWLLHIVGDVHQPLHCATRVSAESPGGDSGGNEVYVIDTDKQIRLHWFWDSCLGAEGDAASIAKLAKTLETSDRKAAADKNPRHWIEESFKLAQTRVYINPIRPGRGPFKLTEEYRQAAQKISRERLALSGERLAKILNDELK